MLLIDGVKYELWTPPTEDEFERVVKEHAQDIFGQDSIYLDLKQKLKSGSGIGSIPDGYVLILGDKPEWHIIEVELSSHPLYDHIVSQVGKFIAGINNPNLQRGITNTLFDEITKDDFLKLRLRKAIEPIETYKFIADLVSKSPILTIVIEEETNELAEAINVLHYPQIKVVEFQTFTREGAESVHAHSFEPLYSPAPKKDRITNTSKEQSATIQLGQEREKRKSYVRGPRVKIKDLIDTGIIKVGQTIYGKHYGTTYEGKISDEGKVLVIHSGKYFDSLSSAASDIKGCSEDGWRWWYVIRENGTECVLDELREEYRNKQSS